MSLPSFALEGKVAVITGAKRGIGKAIALAFAEAGASVAVCSRAVDDGQLEAVADEVRQRGQRCLAIQADVSQKAAVDTMVQKVIDAFGAIDILVNNAAVSISAPLMDTKEGDWDSIMNVDLKGYFLCSQAAGKWMMERKRGTIINIASRLGLKAAPFMGAYGVAKAGELMLTRVLAVELAKDNIRVNAIAPGIVRTEGSASAWSKPEALQRFASAIPLGRIAVPEDIVGAALFLASDASSYITGHTIVVDGGVQA
jgi:NAD(P)-dependent dehydrogenase (short-subunit alcohol dehydrogenase family)